MSCAPWTCFGVDSLNKPPAFQFYADDFIGGTVDLTALETGAYIRLLCFQWGHGRIPATTEGINRVAGCEVSEAVLSKFKDGKNARLEQERRKQAEYRKKQAEYGKKGGRPTKGELKGSLSIEKGSQTSPSPSPSPSPIPIPTPYPTPVEAAEGPKWESAQRWLADWKKNGADYTEFETRGAFLALQASGWRWGRNAVADPRAALERQIQTDRERKHGTNQQNHQPNTRRLTGAEQRQVGIPESRGLGAGEIVRRRTAQRERDRAEQERAAVQTAENGVATPPVQPERH